MDKEDCSLETKEKMPGIEKREIKIEDVFDQDRWMENVLAYDEQIRENKKYVMK